MTSFQVKDEDLVNLKDKVVVITGSSSGIGLATATLLLSLGAHVVGGDVSPSPASISSDSRFTHHHTDVTSWASLSSLFKAAAAKHNHIDHIFANAGIAGKTTYLEDKVDENGDLLEPNHTVLDINLKGVINTVTLGLHYLRKHERGGSVVITASASSFQRFRLVDYATAKHGVLGLMRGMTPLVALLPQKIRVNALCPSWTATGMVPKDFIDGVGLKGQGPEAVARSAAILFADEQRAGQLIYSLEGKFSEVDGALLAAAKGVLGEGDDDETVYKFMQEAAKRRAI